MYSRYSRYIYCAGKKPDMSELKDIDIGFENNDDIRGAHKHPTQFCLIDETVHPYALGNLVRSFSTIIISPNTPKEVRDNQKSKIGNDATVIEPRNMIEMVKQVISIEKCPSGKRA